MRKTLAFAIIAALVGALLPLGSLPGARAEDASKPEPHGPDAVYAKQVESKAALIVALKLVLKFGDNEMQSERNGVVVDPAGVIMTTGLGSFRAAPKIVSARVIFPGDDKEYDAVLGAFDTKLGLSFFRIKDLAGKTIASLDPADSVEVAVGDEVFGVTRVEEGFDYAPIYGTAKIVGQVTKPRTMWLFSGTIGAMAHPLYTAAGKPVGIVIVQQGIAEGRSGSRQFLLPMSAAKGVIASAVKASAKALEEAQSKEKEREKDDGAEKPEKGSEKGMDGAAMDPEPAPMDGGGGPR